MKTLHLSIIIGIGIALIISSFIFFIYPSISNNQQIHTFQVSTVIIPKDSGDPTSDKNYEPRVLVVVLGLNNTVRWINQDELSNTVVADNSDDPDFANATRTHSGRYDIKLTNFLKPGGSFNFTFTKVGDFGYHGEPHPWSRGWVLVLPPTNENLTQTVILNGTGIPNPCEIFGVPCPSNPIFTAQKLGSNIYMEKMTINGVDHYAIIHTSSNPYWCAYPNTIGTACTEPDNLAILKIAKQIY